MEYTLLACLAGVAAVRLDFLLGTRVLRRQEFWIAMGVMYFFMLFVNGYLTARPIVLYGDEFFSGVRLHTIPVEDFVYGFGLMAGTVVLWEYFRKPKR